MTRRGGVDDMGREIKRVPLDFDWPLKKVWQGYINPYSGLSQRCESCEGSGYSPEAKRLYDQWYGLAPFDPGETGSERLTPRTSEVGAFAARNVQRDLEFYLQMYTTTDPGRAIWLESIRLCQLWNGSWCHHLDQIDVQALVDNDRLYDFTHTFTSGKGWQRREDGYIPTAKEVNLWSLSGFGHDSLNALTCVRAKAERLGYELHCQACQGEGSLWPSEEIRQAWDEWKPEEPPEGPGWQVWETVSDGSPVSPVFATDEELVNWLIQEGYSEGAAEEFVKVGWVMSAVMVQNEDGVFFGSDIESLNLPRD